MLIPDQILPLKPLMFGLAEPRTAPACYSTTAPLLLSVQVSLRDLTQPDPLLHTNFGPDCGGNAAVS